MMATLLHIPLSMALLAAHAPIMMTAAIGSHACGLSAGRSWPADCLSACDAGQVGPAEGRYQVICKRGDDLC